MPCCRILGVLGFRSAHGFQRSALCASGCSSYPQVPSLRSSVVLTIKSPAAWTGAAKGTMTSRAPGAATANLRSQCRGLKVRPRPPGPPPSYKTSHFPRLLGSVGHRTK
jgi:hypothetical protein